MRNEEELKKTLIQIDTFLKEEVGRLLFLRLLTAKSILKAAINRKESLGAHYIKN
jgi:L-aspartate oxidase